MAVKVNPAGLTDPGLRGLLRDCDRRRRKRLQFQRRTVTENFIDIEKAGGRTFTERPGVLWRAVASLTSEGDRPSCQGSVPHR